MIATAMDASPARTSGSPRGTLRRDPDHGVLGGVCAGLAAYLGADPLLVRVAFVAATAAGGVGLALYVLGWAFLPLAAGATPRTRRTRTGRAAVETGLGAGLLLLSALLALREAGLWFSDAIVWPLVLVATGGALLWRQSQVGGAQRRTEAWPTGPSPAPLPNQAPDAGGDRPPSDFSARAGVVSRTGLGIALVIAAGLAFLQATGSLSAARDVVLAALVVAVVLGVIFAPWIVRLARSLASERAERIRSQERAEVAAHLHDSVLQTLALMQKRAGQPREVATLARHQERELRAWLSDRPPPHRDVSLAATLEATAEEVERTHGVPIDVVTVGDCRLDAPVEALVGAAREAMVNAAKFAGDSAVDVYAEAGAERVQVFVRDRGPGFDLAAVPADRRGVRESIIGRMDRHGGRAVIHSVPASGTEVELSLDRSPR